MYFGRRILSETKKRTQAEKWSREETSNDASICKWKLTSAKQQQQSLFHATQGFYRKRALNGGSPRGSFSSRQGVILSEHLRNRLLLSKIMHMRSHHGIKAYVCEICGNRFSSHGSKHNHMRRHGNASPFTCPVCQKAFVWELSLKGHLKSHAKQGDITESMADELYVQQRTEHKIKKKAEKLRRVIDSIMKEHALPENCEGVNMPSAEYEMNYGAATYSPNTNHATM
ncbi:Zinc finger protein [Trichinella pseudospiralis]|uniref:Zinc finger protein n=1 Tax=Trichinella pseudospiralis TaxID=6337 RepID=A0A0V1JNU8_TRIPS|nr:Zinc finger protein [Trichinella pseudospiralis]